MSTEKLGAGSIANFKLIVAGKIMARVPLLAKLNEAQLGTVLKESRIATYEAGDVLIFEGDIGNKQSGVVKYKLHVFGNFVAIVIFSNYFVYFLHWDLL